MANEMEIPADLKVDFEKWVNLVFTTLETEKVPVELCPAVMLNALYNFQATLIREQVKSGKVMPNVAIQTELRNTKLFFSEIEKRLKVMLSTCVSQAPNLH